MAITLDGTAGITTPDLTDTSLTATRVVYAGTSGNLTGASTLTFDGTTLSSSIASAASGVSLDSSTAGKSNIVFKSAGSQKSIVGLAGAILGTSSTDLGLFAETGGAIKLYANGASTNSGTFNQYGFGIGAAIPSSGQGITFPAAQDASSNANTLDDYEEGSWTPASSFTGGNGTRTDTVTGKYTKIGDMVYANFDIAITKGTASGNLSVTGLPFARGGQDNRGGGVMFVYISMATLTNGLIAYIGDNQSSFTFFNGPNLSNVTAAGNLGTSSQFIGTVIYKV
jgi:hypothetical protein